MRKEFELWAPNCEKERKNRTLAIPILTRLRACAGNPLTPEEIARFVLESEGVHIEPTSRGIKTHINWARRRGLISPNEKIWAIWGVGFVDIIKKITAPKTLSEINISIWEPPPSDSDEPPILFVIPGISLLNEAKVKQTRNPSPERVIRAFDAVEVFSREGYADCLKPLLVGETRQLVACLANVEVEM